MIAVKANATTVEKGIQRARSMLGHISDQPDLEGQVLLSDVLGVEKAWLLAHGEAALTADQETRFQARLEQRRTGVPLPYVLGWWEFYSRRFVVGPSVLIPRPETECLVDVALDRLLGHAEPPRVLDVGTGSGCIGITIAAESASSLVVGTDRSLAALEVAGRNAAQLGVHSRVRLVCADLALGLRLRFDVVCANLPYIPTGDLPDWDVSRWEPDEALDGGPEGLTCIGRLLTRLPELLVPEGLALIEIGARQAEAALQLAGEALPGWKARVHPDLAGVPRVLQIRPGRDR